MSKELGEIIEREELILDSMRLSEWNRNAGKSELIKKIERLKHNFIDENVVSQEETALIFKLVEEIKDII